MQKNSELCPILGLKIEKNGGFLRVCGCFFVAGRFFSVFFMVGRVFFVHVVDFVVLLG